MVSPVIFWFLRGLRHSDDRALSEETRRGDGNAVPVHLVDPDLAGSVGLARGAHLIETLRALDVSLDAAVERHDPPARLHEARQRARTSSINEDVT